MNEKPNDYLILTDSTCDLTADLVKRLGVEVLPMVFTVDGREYVDRPDGGDLPAPDFYRMLREGKQGHTAAINLTFFLNAFENYLKAGRDVLYIAFSSALSGTYNNGLLAAQELAPKYPQRQIRVLDSRCASMGEGLLVWHAARQKRRGLSMTELYDWLTERRGHLCHWFTVDDLNHLKRGGRISAATALLGTALGIKPILHVDDEGRLVPVGKVRGRRRSLNELVGRMESLAENPEEQTVFISHGDAVDDARYLEAEVRRRMKVREIDLNFIGPVIGTHSGPGTIAVFFLGRHR